jgi:adenylate kinase family enzyme
VVGDFRWLTLPGTVGSRRTDPGKARSASVTVAFGRVDFIKLLLNNVTIGCSILTNLYHFQIGRASRKSAKIQPVSSEKTRKTLQQRQNCIELATLLPWSVFMTELKLISLPPYPKFARIFKLMLTRMALNNPYAMLSSDQDGAVGKYFFQNNDPYIYKNGYYKWIKGELEDKTHSLRADNLERFLIDNLGRPGLTDYNFIAQLLHVGPLEYRNILDRGEFLKQLDDKGIKLSLQPEKNPVPFQNAEIRKKTIDREILSIFRKKRKPTWRIMLTGCPGCGKSTILRVLANTTFLTSYDQIIWLDAATKESLKQSLTSALWALCSLPEINHDVPVSNQLMVLKARIQKQRAILLVENCHQKDVFEMIVGDVPEKCDWIIEMKRSDLATEIDPPGEFTCEVPSLTQVERDAYWKYIASPVKNMDREVFDRLCLQTKNNPDELFQALGSVANLRVDWALEEHEATPHKTILERTFEHLNQEQKKRFTWMGALTQFYSFDMNVFTALWECDEHDAYRELTCFAGFNWLEELSDGRGWVVSTSVLRYAADLLVKTEAEEKHRAEQWIKRIDLKGLKIKFSDQHRIGLRKFLQLLRKGPRLHPNFLFRTANQFLDPVNQNTYWNLFKGSESWMRSEEWLVARYLYQTDVKTFRWMQGLIVFFILISLLGDETLPLKDVVVAILISPILILLLATFISLTPRLRNSEAISLQIWYAVQERRMEGEVSPISMSDVLNLQCNI